MANKISTQTLNNRKLIQRIIRSHFSELFQTKEERREFIRFLLEDAQIDDDQFIRADYIYYDIIATIRNNESKILLTYNNLDKQKLSIFLQKYEMGNLKTNRTSIWDDDGNSLLERYFEETEKIITKYGIDGYGKIIETNLIVIARLLFDIKYGEYDSNRIINDALEKLSHLFDVLKQEEYCLESQAFLTDCLSVLFKRINRELNLGTAKEPDNLEGKYPEIRDELPRRSSQISALCKSIWNKITSSVAPKKSTLYASQGQDPDLQSNNLTPISIWYIKIIFKDKHIDAVKTSYFLWNFTQLLGLIIDVNVEIYEWGRGSLFVKLKVLMKSLLAKDEVKEVLDKSRAAIKDFIEKPTLDKEKTISEIGKNRAEIEFIKKQTSTIPSIPVSEKDELDFRKYRAEVVKLELDNIKKEAEVIREFHQLNMEGIIGLGDFDVYINKLPYLKKNNDIIIRGDDIEKIADNEIKQGSTHSIKYV